MKVALFVHCFYPDHFYGTETYTLDLARHLRGMGHDVTVVSAVFAGEPKTAQTVTNYMYDEIPVVCLDKNYYPNTRVKDTYYQPDFRDVLRSVLRELDPDIIHVTHLINHTAALLEVMAETNKPLVATLTDFFGFCFNNKLETADGDLCAGPNRARTNCLACYLKDASANQVNRPSIQWLSHPSRVIWTAKLLNMAVKVPPLKSGSVDGLVQDIKARPDTLRHFYKRYDAMITPTRFLQNAYRSNNIAGVMKNMWFGVDIDRSDKPVRDPKHVLQIGFIGQLAAHKGTDLLVDAFATLPKGSAQLRIYGPKDQSPPYTALLEQKSRGLDVKLLGTFPPAHMAHILSEIDVLVIPSRWYENSPLVLLNALASHTPVIVSDVPGLTEFVDEGVNGFAFERGDWKALGKVLRRFVDGSVDAARMGHATNFDRTTRTMAEEVHAVYQEVLTARAAQTPLVPAESRI